MPRWPDGTFSIDDAARHLKQAQDSLDKIRAKQAERQKQREHA